MDAQNYAELNEHVEAIAKILYSEADPADLKTMEGIEKQLRSLVQEHITPQLGFFLSKHRQGQQQEKVEP